MLFIERVKQALENAKANGYTFEGVTCLGIAEDMVKYNYDLEDENIEHIVEAIKVIRSNEI